MGFVATNQSSAPRAFNMGVLQTLEVWACPGSNACSRVALSAHTPRVDYHAAAYPLQSLTHNVQSSLKFVSCSYIISRLRTTP